MKKGRITGGFWKKRQDINRHITAEAVYRRFEETGRFDIEHEQWRLWGKPEPHIYWDSDVAKWIEGAAWLLAEQRDEWLERVIDETVDAYERIQDENGYFNSWFHAFPETEKLKDRTAHELYCAGHLIEAGIAYKHATGKDKLFSMACRYADYIDQVFRVEGTAGFCTPGHEEIELALVKLYDETGEARYLGLADFFLEKRGNNEKDTVGYDFATKEYFQDHLPVSQQRTAEGHAVRAVYLYGAMADVGLRTGKKPYLDGVQALFDNIVTRRMYITGAIGSSCGGEAFTADYDLPNLTAYGETCAAIGFFLFACRMPQIQMNGKYEDAAEVTLYNAVLSGVSLDGKKFYYENALERIPALMEVDRAVKKPCIRYPASERKEVFQCSCCPPNLLRFIASVSEYLVSASQDTVFIHHYMESIFTGDGFQVTQKTDYPVSGVIRIRITGRYRRLALRIPGWADKWSVDRSYTEKTGYVYLDCGEDDEICLELSMEPKWMEASVQVAEDCGKLALMRGPVVYCLEEEDNGKNLRDIRIKTENPVDVKCLKDDPYGLPVLETKGYRRNRRQQGLYREYRNSREEIVCRWIPYFAHSNRSAGEMEVWTDYE